MSFSDDLLLDGGEPPPWTEEDAPFGLCDFCETPLVGQDDCAVCAPRADLDYSPVRVTVTIDTATGAASWSGWCAS